MLFEKVGSWFEKETKMQNETASIDKKRARDLGFNQQHL